MNRKRLLITIVVAAMLLVAGCTGSTDEPADGSGPMIENGTHSQDPGAVHENDTIYYDNGTTRKVTYNSEKIEEHLFELINEFRAENNAGQAGYSKSLASSAAAKSYHMVENDYFAHDSPGGLDKDDFISQIGECEGNTGENLAGTYAGEPGDPITNKEVAEKIFNQWRTSDEGHRDVMLMDGSPPSSIEMGIGIYILEWDQNSNYIEFYTTLHTCH